MKLFHPKSPEGRAAVLSLAALTVLCLLPFVDKAFHIDDPLFIWTARQIQAHPWDFYGFDVNWYGRIGHMSEVTQNPPLAAYYMALVGGLFGWSEDALHAGFLLPAVLAVIGTYYLARHFCSHAFEAALVVLTAPVFVLCSSSVMCDTSMVACWVWALHFWIEGLKQESRGKLFAASLLMAACALTKYFGISLIGLALAHGLLEKYPVRRWLSFLATPVVILGFYQWWTFHLYGHALLGNAVAYAVGNPVGGALPSKLITTFAFMGGCMAVLPAAAPCLWGGRRSLAAIPVFVLVGMACVMMRKVGLFQVAGEEGVLWGYVAQLSFWTVGGLGAAALAAADWRREKTAESLLLTLWVAGTFIFTCALNWTVSGRNILPMLPAVAMLLVRRLEAREQAGGDGGLSGLWMLLAFSLGLALLAARADYQLADSERAAVAVFRKQAGDAAGTARFEGHWGFQYYMQQIGATPLVKVDPGLKPNQAIVMPLNNSNYYPLPRGEVVEWFHFEVPSCSWSTTLNSQVGAGYYSDGWGPLPFVFGRIPAEEYMVYRALARVKVPGAD